jgi:tetratricopeptide (TPR) repeat protein
VLLQLTECQAAGDLIETGNGMLALAFLVNWVRSDTAQPPFARSHELAMQALDVFRRADDAQGQIKALVAASAMADPATTEAMLAEADALAETLGDENLVAMILAARARRLSLKDRERGTELHRRAFEIYRRTGNERGQARSLFSLSIGEGEPAEKRDYALEAARLYRGFGDRGEASRCVTIALMMAGKIQPLTDLECLIREGLEDAIAADDRKQTACFYEKLAAIAFAKGQIEAAEEYRGWSTDLDHADGLTPLERWEQEVEIVEMMLETARVQGNDQTAMLFQAELERLKASKPSA